MMFGIVQGGLFEDLRQRSAESITSLGFPGYAIGGLSVGESKREMYEATVTTAQMLPVESPRYLMGVGSPENLVECVARGVDLFDCALPTRIARSGAMFVRTGRVNIYNALFKNQEAPIEDGCDCYTCRTFSAAYVHHLFRSKELLGLPAVEGPQPALRAAPDGGDAVSHQGSPARVVPCGVPGPVRPDRRGNPEDPEAQMGGRPAAAAGAVVACWEIDTV